MEKLDCDHDLENWKECGSTETDIKKRKIALNKFIAKISTPRDNARKRKKIRVKIVKPVYNKGDCLSFKMSNGNYGGAIVLEAEHNGEAGLNFIASTTINKSERPNISDFESASILTIWDTELYGNIKTKLLQEEFIAYWFQAKPYNEYRNSFERIGNIEIKRSFEHTFLGHFRIWIPWDVLIVFSELTFDRVSKGQCQSKIVSVKDWSK